MSGKQGKWSRIVVNAGVCEGECMGSSPGDESLTLMRCRSCRLPQLYEAFEGWKSVCGRAYNLKSIKGKILVSLLFLKLFLFYCSSFHAMIPRWREEVIFNR